MQRVSQGVFCLYTDGVKGVNNKCFSFQINGKQIPAVRVFFFFDFDWVFFWVYNLSPNSIWLKKICFHKYLIMFWYSAVQYVDY